MSQTQPEASNSSACSLLKTGFHISEWPPIKWEENINTASLSQGPHGHWKSLCYWGSRCVAAATALTRFKGWSYMMRIRNEASVMCNCTWCHRQYILFLIILPCKLFYVPWISIKLRNWWLANCYFYYIVVGKSRPCSAAVFLLSFDIKTLQQKPNSEKSHNLNNSSCSSTFLLTFSAEAQRSNSG